MILLIDGRKRVRHRLRDRRQRQPNICTRKPPDQEEEERGKKKKEGLAQVVTKKASATESKKSNECT